MGEDFERVLCLLDNLADEWVRVDGAISIGRTTADNYKGVRLFETTERITSQSTELQLINHQGFQYF